VPEIAPLPLFFAAALGYFLGAIPFGLIFSHLGGLGDIRKIGSGNIGATNVLRSGKKGIAVATLLFDAAKGGIALILASHLWGADAGLVAGAFSVLGHNFPAWLKFKGGKGVATSFGVLLAASPGTAGLAFLTWVFVAFLFRYSSLAALLAFALSPLYALWLSGDTLVLLASFLAALGIFRHSANIKRLVQKKEPKIGEKSKTP
jgi:acyl phosphate:glycerol-3-phosphate acyltransferase